MQYSLLVLILTTLFSTTLQASTKASGMLLAQQPCPAFQSFRKKTNPDNIAVAPRSQYPIIEVNRYPNPTRYRILVNEAHPQERWVAATCGTVNNLAATPSRSKKQQNTANAEQCQTPGLADSYVLALSWQPAFCETHGKKPECQVRDPQSFQANNFTLHGLWPNLAACKTRYGFCSKVKSHKPFCSYPSIELLSPVVKKKMGIKMPSVAHQTCLQRHEWYKHGVCQTQMNADAYFSLAMQLQDEFNQNGIAQFMADHRGKIVQTEAFFKVFDRYFGVDMHKRLSLKCDRNKNLVDVHIRLPKDILGNSLKSLLSQSKNAFSNRCKNTFRIDPIND